MKKIHIVVNDEKDKELKVAGRILGFLEARNVKCSLERIRRDESQRKPYEADIDCIITLGGDGTFIQVASGAAGSNIPMLGVNLGTTGYLTEVEKDGIEPALERLLASDFEIENRMMLSGEFRGTEAGEKQHYALNDVVISRIGSLRAVSFELIVNDRKLNTYDADGMIVATPTGSTGYSLSAGGPIVEPTARLIVVNPICPHTLNTRAIVLSAEDTVRIRVLGGRSPQEYEAGVSCDGGRMAKLGVGSEVEICCAEVETRLIRLGKESFLDLLSRKLGG
ncbi:MAG: NAD(+)/NADH kinase [Lachnospiraceae bacterium]|nr:NAD(+)/NADH kinase [Lachnospiraceae bacterium]